MELVVQPLGRSLAVKAGDNLLDALQANDMLVSCSCRGEIFEGHVLESTDDANLTNPGEDSYVLACMSVITESCVVLKSSKPLSFSLGQYALPQFTPDHIRPSSPPMPNLGASYPFSAALVFDSQVMRFNLRTCSRSYCATLICR